MDNTPSLLINNQLFHVIRKVHRLSMSEYGKLLGISQTYVARIESDHEPVTENVRYKLVNRFNLDNEKVREIMKTYEKYDVKPETYIF